MSQSYPVRTDLRPRKLAGISDEQIGQHWALYEGYVKNVNLLNAKLAVLREKRSFGPEFAELKRRLGFEYDGMILHEHYFGILKGGQKPPGDDAETAKLMKSSFGGHAAWRREFAAVGNMRGPGWAILYYDPSVQALTNHWIGDHEVGHPAGFIPILVMDVWEHAYMVDAGAGGRAAYVEAFLANVDWPRVERNIEDASHSAAVRF